MVITRLNNNSKSGAFSRIDKLAAEDIGMFVIAENSDKMVF